MRSLEEPSVTGWRVLRRLGGRAMFFANQAIGIVGGSIILLMAAPWLLLLRVSSRPRASVFFVGLEHIIQKTAERGRWFAERGYLVYYFSREASGVDSSRFVRAGLVKTPSLVIFDVCSWLYYLLTRRPAYVETYLFDCSFRTIFYLLACKAAGVFTTVVLRGETHPGSMWGARSWYWRACLELCLRLASKLLRRELKEGANATRFADKIVFDHNCTTVRPLSARQYPDTVLYLNSFKPFRRVDLLARAVKLVVQQIPTARFLFVGFRRFENPRIVLDICETDGVSQAIEVHPFNEDAARFYEQASVFVLTADPWLTFLNYSLLEAMERGLVPVLSNYEDARYIVQHGVNGVLVQQTAAAIAEAIVGLLQNKRRLAEMGNEARFTIVRRFNNETRMSRLRSMIDEYYSIRQEGTTNLELEVNEGRCG